MTYQAITFPMTSEMKKCKKENNNFELKVPFGV